MATKSDAVVKLVFVFFITLLSFSIGTFVGKKYSDNQHQLAALEPQKANEGAHREVASVHEEGEQRTGAMTDEEIAKLAEEFVADETEAIAADAHDSHAAPTHGEPAHGKKAHSANTAHPPAPIPGGHAVKPDAKSEAHNPRPGKNAPHITNAEPSKTAQDLAAGHAPEMTATAKKTPAKTETRVPTSLPKDVAQYSVGKFTVQVASYPEESVAQKMASDLKDKGYSAFYIPANIKGKTYYRVSVGQFATQKEAQAYRSEFMGKAKMTSAIVQKITE